MRQRLERRRRRAPAAAPRGVSRSSCRTPSAGPSRTRGAPRSTRRSRSTSRHSPPNASSGRTPVPARKTTSGPSVVIELGGDRIDLIPGVERIDLARLGLRVLHQRRRVLLDPLPSHRRLQHLPQRAMRPIALALRQRRAPRRDLIDRATSRSAPRRTRPAPARMLSRSHATRRRRRVVLTEVGVDQLTQRRARPMQRTQPHAPQRLLERCARLCLACGTRASAAAGRSASRYRIAHDPAGARKICPRCAVTRPARRSATAACRNRTPPRPRTTGIAPVGSCPASGDRGYAPRGSSAGSCPTRAPAAPRSRAR